MADKKIYMATRKDSQTRIFFYSGIRFDIGGNVISEDQYKKLKKNRDIKQIEKKILDISEVDTKSLKAVKKAIFDCETKPAKINAKRILGITLEELTEAAEKAA